jgi:outer membrane biosynthesis protein TonB
MNIKQANIILEKVNRLYKSMTLDPSNIDEFEQELMLSYIRQLHGAFSTNEKTKKKKRQKTELPPVVSFPKPEKNPTPKPKPKATKMTPKATPPPPKPNPIKVETPPPAESKPKPAPNPTTPKVAATSASKDDFSELFNHEEAKELSEKLSDLPIKDLTKAMGLNEKIFTINELFGGDNKAFDTALKTLNTFNSFDQAKAYLSENFAGKHNWDSKTNKKKAITFIKLVRRRYN